MKEGFYTALGTPLDEGGRLVEDSFRRQVENQIAAGASGLLAMGSMGIEACIGTTEYPKVSAAAAEAAGGRCPVFVGVMDNSVSRVVERIESLAGIAIDGVVATTPFYYALTQDEVTAFFREIARRSPFPLYLYDLPAVTKTKIAVETAENLSQNKNIRGIKTGDLTTAKELTLRCGNDFSVLFSGLDVFDIAYFWGLRMNLDGMFCCAANPASAMYRHLAAGDHARAAACLGSILFLRNRMAEMGIFKGFTCAMNLLGYEGSFSPDYTGRPDEKDYEAIRQCMRQFGAC